MKKVRITRHVSTSTLSSGGELIMRLMHSRTAAHIAHLSVPKTPGSLALHKALNAYYDGIVDLIDRLVETHQGYTGEILQYPDVPYFGIADPTNPVDYFEVLKNDLDEAAQKTSQQALLNIIAETSELVCGTLYQLRFLM